MSGQANCFDNACVESFFATLKRERVYRRRYRSRAEARADLFDYIEVFYNRQRRHSLLGHRTGNRGKRAVSTPLRQPDSAFTVAPQAGDERGRAIVTDGL